MKAPAHEGRNLRGRALCVFGCSGRGRGAPHCAVPRGTQQKCIIYYQGRKRVLVWVDVRADGELMRYLSAAAGLYAAPFGSCTLRMDVPFLVFVFVFCAALRVWRSLPPVPRFSSALWHYPQMPTGGAGVIFGYSLMGHLYQVFVLCAYTQRGACSLLVHLHLNRERSLPLPEQPSSWRIFSVCSASISPQHRSSVLPVDFLDWTKNLRQSDHGLKYATSPQVPR